MALPLDDTLDAHAADRPSSVASAREGGSAIDDAPVAERRVVVLLAAVQFVNILDFMMPSPLGPRFSSELGIPTSSIGIVVASYTLAAGVAGFLGAFFLDRYSRRSALVVTLIGLGVGTFGAVIATDLPSLVLARVVAGAFGGPATSLAMAIVADTVPVVRRGRALGTMMMAFSVASILGVPMGLVLADWGSWHTPFVVTALLSGLAALAARLLLPKLDDHVDRRAAKDAGTRELVRSLRTLVTDRAVQVSYAMALASAFGSFLVIPYLATFVENNLGYPERLLSLLYASGGAASFIVLRPLGRLVDRVGSFPVALLGSVGYAIVASATFVALPRSIDRLGEARVRWLGHDVSPIWLVTAALFVLFMLTNNARNVAFGTLISRVPAAALRARYQSLSSMVQHAGLGAGGIVGAWLLSSDAAGNLVGMERSAGLSLLVLLAIPWLLRVTEHIVDRRDGIEHAPARSRT